jgi:WD40 repeat protein/serine/threonine protein kinase
MSDETRLRELLLRWEELHEEGQSVSATELCRDCPELIEPLQQRIGALQSLEGALDTGPGAETACNPAAAPDADETQLRSARPGRVSVSHLVSHLPDVPGYEVLRELGRGGMGVVYLARHRKLDRLVALKMILAAPGARLADLARFEREGQAVARLQDPSIVQIFEVGEHAGQPYYVMEFVAGRSLREHIAGKPQPPAQAAELLEKLARAIHSAHQAGIIHRDLKPGNILLQPVESGEPGAVESQESRAQSQKAPAAQGPLALDCSGLSAFRPKIMDFGLAKRLDTDGGPTVTGDILGTPSYMAPEQASGKPVGPAADIYALGAILYVLLTGHPPFQAENSWDTILQVVQEEPIPPRRLQRTLPRDLETICLKCLQKEPGKRYPTALALAEDLARYRAGMPIQARPPGILGRTVKWARRRPASAALIVVSVAAVLALALGGLVYQANLRTALHKAEEHEDEARRRLVRLQVVEGTRLLDSGDWLAALLWFAEALRLDEGRPGREEMHRRRFAITLRQCPRLAWVRLHGGPVRQAVFSFDGRWVLTASEDRTARVWDVATGEPIGEPWQHAGPVWDAAFRPDGLAAVTAAGDSTARVWEVGTGQPLTPPLKHERAVLSVSFRRDGQRVATASEDGSARVWDARTGQAITPPLRHGSAVRWVTFSPEGERVASASDDGTARVWNATTGQAVTPPLKHAGPVLHLAFAPDGRRLVTASADRTAQLWDAASGAKHLAPLRHRRAVVRASFSPDGRTVLSASDDNTVAFWNADSGEPRGQPLKHRSGVHVAAFDRTGRLVVTGSEDNTARVWRAATGEPLTPLLRHNGSVNAAVLSPDGRRVATTGNGGAVRLWEISIQPPPTPAPGQAAAFALQRPRRWPSPDGRLVVTVEDGHNARLRLAATGAPVGPPLKHGSVVTYAAFSADGRCLLTGSDDNRARIWDVASGELLAPPLEHDGAIHFGAFSADDRLVVTAAADRTARVWDARTGQVLTPRLPVPAGVKQAEFSPDGSHLTLTCTEVLSRSWELAPDDRPVAELTKLAQRLAGGRIDPRRGFLPLEPAQLQALWAKAP